jgi:hypothetical protein
MPGNLNEIVRSQIPLLENLQLTTDGDVFLEVLLSNVKGNVISFQQWVKKTENTLKSRLVNRLNELKLDFNNNQDTIYETENELLMILDKEVSEKAKTIKIFECLNAEKPTPIFMNLARCRNTSKRLSAICKDDGTAYSSDAERNEGIVDFFEKLYKKPETERVDYTDCIENFLGPKILAHPVVQNSLLTEPEIALLDRPLSINELDESVKKANLKSSPGMDGLCNRFILKYWQLLRGAVFRYCEKCFEKGTLTANFLNASIKLVAQCVKGLLPR